MVQTVKEELVKIGKDRYAVQIQRRTARTITNPHLTNQLQRHRKIDKLDLRIPKFNRTVATMDYDANVINTLIQDSLDVIKKAILEKKQNNSFTTNMSQKKEEPLNLTPVAVPAPVVAETTAQTEAEAQVEAVIAETVETTETVESVAVTETEATETVEAIQEEVVVGKKLLNVVMVTQTEISEEIAAALDAHFIEEDGTLPEKILINKEIRELLATPTESLVDSEKRIALIDGLKKAIRTAVKTEFIPDENGVFVIESEQNHPKLPSILVELLADAILTGKFYFGKSLVTYDDGGNANKKYVLLPAGEVVEANDIVS